MADDTMTPERIAAKLLYEITNNAGDGRTYYFAYVVEDSGMAIAAIADALRMTEKHATERAARILDDAASAYAARWEANDTGRQYIKLLKRHAAVIREG